MRMHDRLSVLPDDLILKILCFLDVKDSIRTSVLSPRWRYLWTSIPCLSFSGEHFSTIHKLSDFVDHVLSRRNTQVQLSSFKLDICREGGQDVGRRIMNDAFSLNVQQLNISCSFDDWNIDPLDTTPKVPIFLSLPENASLKHLTFSWVSADERIITTSTREFSSLSTLHFVDITLCGAFLSMCPNLENLTLHRCKMATGSLIISHPRLSNLTLENVDSEAHDVSIVTPKLKNLTILKYFGGFRISAPQLASLLIRGLCPFKFSTDGLRSLEKAQLSLHSLGWSHCTPDASTIVGMLQDFHNVKHLSLSAEIIGFLNLSVELISHQPSPLANLKNLRILPKVLCHLKHRRTRVVMSTEVKNYLLSGSPKATLTEVLREKCCDITAGADPHSIDAFAGFLYS